MPSDKFIFPACNSRNEPAIALISPIPPNVITELATCPDCGAHIPAHIAFRWKGMGAKKASEEWLRYQRKTKSGSPLPETKEGTDGSL